MSFLPLSHEDEVIDSYAPSVQSTSPVVTQSDNPNEDLQVNYFQGRQELPNPSLGGETGSGERNGFSNGFRSFFNRTQRFSGAVIRVPNPPVVVQGEVGNNNRSARLYAGVMDQLTNYSASQAQYNAAWVGGTPGNAPARTLVGG